MAQISSPNHHWNYFLALEKDLEQISRYIEFTSSNFSTYSIQLSHLLLSASSEVDVVMKQLCSIYNPSERKKNIRQYYIEISSKAPGLIKEEVSIDRFGLVLRPWIHWSLEDSPLWWKSYNNVKHERNEFFQQASLENVINALSALLITVIYYYNAEFSFQRGSELTFKDTTRILSPESSFLKVKADYYYQYIIT